MAKEEIEKILEGYGVSFTSALAERLCEEFKKERAEVIEEILQLPKHNHYDMCNELMYQSISVEDLEMLKEKKE